MKALVKTLPRELDLRSIYGYIVESYDEFRGYEKTIKQFIVTDKYGACDDITTRHKGRDGLIRLFWKGLNFDSADYTQEQRGSLFFSRTYTRADIILKTENRSIPAVTTDLAIKNWSEILHSKKGDIWDIQGLPDSIHGFSCGRYAPYTDRTYIGRLFMGPPPLPSGRDPPFLHSIVNKDFRERENFDYYDLCPPELQEIELTLDDLDKMLRERSGKYRNKTPINFVKNISKKS